MTYFIGNKTIVALTLSPSIAIVEFMRNNYGFFLIIAVLLLWNIRLLTWRYNINIYKFTCNQKEKKRIYPKDRQHILKKKLSDTITHLDV